MNPDDKLVIHSYSEKGFWSNDDGWVSDVESATQFTREEAATVNLPLSSDGDAGWMLVAYAD